MRWLLMLENPWCLMSMLLMIVLLVVAAALTAWSRRRDERETARLSGPRLQGLGTTAPLEALYGLSERLAHVQRQLPFDSEDAVWLGQFRVELQHAIESAHNVLSRVAEAERGALLTRLDNEVADLDRIVSQHLATRLSQTTNRAALHFQLEQLHAALTQPRGLQN